jgi:hypothetical protein
MLEAKGVEKGRDVTSYTNGGVVTDKEPPFGNLVLDFDVAQLNVTNGLIVAEDNPMIKVRSIKT